MQGRLVGLFAGEIGFECRIVLLDRGFDQSAAEDLRLGHHLWRDLDDVELGAQGLFTPLDRPHADEIDDSDKIALDAQRQLHDQRARPEPVGDHRDAAREIGAGPIHLVDEAYSRHAVLVGLAPHGLGLRLDPRDRIKDGDGAVEHAQAALDLDREIDMAGRVDDVDAVIVPKAGRRGRGDRNAALLLLRHPIHRGGALVHFADFVGPPGVIENPLGRRGLAGIDMRHDADIAVSLEGCLSCHERSSEVRR